MLFKKLGVAALGLILLVAFSAPIWADVPDSNTGPGWYTGVWKVTFVEKCRDHEGKRVNIKKKTFYWDVTATDTSFGGTLYNDEELMDPAWSGPDMFLIFPPFPGAGDETFICSGPSGFDITNPFTGTCSGSLLGYLKTKQDKWDAGMTDKKVTQLRKKSKLRGWDFFGCTGPDDLLYCASKWTAKWIDGPAYP